LAALAGAVPAGATPSPWAPVAPVDTRAVHPADFGDDDLDLPFYLVHFHRLANAVVEHGSDRGFIDLSVWRNPRGNMPYNARILENAVSLAYFYATPRPWNPYYGRPEVRVRLEAVLDFWCRKQNPVDGRFSEYGPGEWNLAATAFATKFMGETLTLLKDGPPIDASLHARVLAADRRAIEAVLTLPILYEHGKDFTNQYTNAYAGALAYLSLHPDPELARRLEARMQETSPVFQSPAGYFYEQKGPDFGYNLGTHESNARMCLFYAHGSPLGELVVEESRRFYEWIGYNAVPEPDGRVFFLNRGVETRQRVPFIDRQDADSRGAPPRAVEAAWPFLATQEETKDDVAQRRRQLEQTWPRVPDLAVGQGTAFSPYVFLHRRHGRFTPTAAEHADALAALPALARDKFTHQRFDPRQGLVFTYVRRPGYYATFNSGRRLMEQQRYGLGLLWTRAAGALLQSQTASVEAAWGTRAADADQVYEAGDLPAEIRLDGRRVTPEPGARDLEGTDLEVCYPLGQAGTKEIHFREREVLVSVTHPGPFTEQLPLLVAEGLVLERQPGRITLLGGGRPVLSITFDGSDTAAETPGPTLAGKGVRALSIPAQDRLRYTLALP
jgi:hypothetical protein